MYTFVNNSHIFFHIDDRMKNNWRKGIMNEICRFFFSFVNHCERHYHKFTWKHTHARINKKTIYFTNHILLLIKNTQQCKRKTHTDFWLTCCVSKNQSETEPHNSYSAEKAQWRAQEELLALHSDSVYEYICACIKYYMYMCKFSIGLYSYYFCCCCWLWCCCFSSYAHTHTKIIEHIQMGART